MNKQDVIATTRVVTLSVLGVYAYQHALPAVAGQNCELCVSKDPGLPGGAYCVPTGAQVVCYLDYASATCTGAESGCIPP